MRRWIANVVSVLCLMTPVSAVADMSPDSPPERTFMPLNRGFNHQANGSGGKVLQPSAIEPVHFFPLNRKQNFTPLARMAQTSVAGDWSEEAKASNVVPAVAKHADPYAMSDEQAQQILSLFSSVD